MVEKLEKVKVILIGETQTGKTSLINKLVYNTFDPNEKSTVEFNRDGYKTLDDLNVEFNFWDTAGNEKFRPLNKIFIRSSRVLLFVYSITDKKSFDEIKEYWYKTSIEICHKNPGIIYIYI